MNNEFNVLKNEFLFIINEWLRKYSLKDLPCYKNLDYKLIRTIVYNIQLDEIIPEEIKIILVGDNPGINEQAQNAYLVGKSGSMAANFFKEVYNYDFYKNILIITAVRLSHIIQPQIQLIAIGFYNYTGF